MAGAATIMMAVLLESGPAAAVQDDSGTIVLKNDGAVDTTTVTAQADKMIADGQALVESGIQTENRQLKRSGMRMIRDGLKKKRSLGAVEGAQ